MRQAVAGVMVLLLLGLGASGARAAEIKVLSTGNMVSILTEITGEFERTTGHKLVIDIATKSRMQQRFKITEPAKIYPAIRA
jgi:hypothetical protein